MPRKSRKTSLAQKPQFEKQYLDREDINRRVTYIKKKLFRAGLDEKQKEKYEKYLIKLQHKYIARD